MINPQERFFTGGQICFGSSEDPRSRVHCEVFDWDQLRWVTIVGTAKLFPRDEDAEIPIFARLVDELPSDAHRATVDDDGFLVSVSTDPENDYTLYVPYLRYSTLESLRDCRTVQYHQLHEIDRLGPGVDLSSYQDEDGNNVQVAFKFNPWEHITRRQMIWNEIHILKNLPTHPNLVPFDRVVLGGFDSRVIGFTTKYITGGTLNQNTTIPFRLKWLQQLTNLVDFLNLELGIMHQDIAPRNLLIDPETQDLLLFDFNWAVCGSAELLDGRDDVTGAVFTVYELITNDTHYTSIPHWERDMNTVQDLPEWVPDRQLDSDVSTFRKFLNEWVATRKADGDMERYLNAPRRLTLPPLPHPPEYDVPFEAGATLNGKPVPSKGARYRRHAIANGQYCFDWQRPPQNFSLRNGNGWHQPTSGARL
ncbi:MAG: hypothetical protein M1820_002117 [Bogoriella megaspora]|nr:MAG: hypothetical protein M1820_002117 [Bogoriella megaspora]